MFYCCSHRERTRRKSQTVTMPHQLKLNCPICNYPRLAILSDHLTKVHGINRQERKCLLAKARFAVFFTQPDHPQSSIPQSDSIPAQFGNSLPKASSLPEQKKLPNPVPSNCTSDQNEDELIPCPYYSRIGYERIWGTNVPVMDYDIFKLHHPFSMLVAGPRGAGKSEFVKQLLSMKRFIMTNPPERIVWFYGRHQPDLFCSLAQEMPCKSFMKDFLRILKSCLIEVNETFVSLTISCRVRAGISWSKTSLPWKTFESVCRVRESKFILYGKEMQNHLFEFNLDRGSQESKRSISNSSPSMSDVPI